MYEQLSSAPSSQTDEDCSLYQELHHQPTSPSQPPGYTAKVKPIVIDLNPSYNHNGAEIYLYSPGDHVQGSVRLQSDINREDIESMMIELVGTSKVEHKRPNGRQLTKTRRNICHFLQQAPNDWGRHSSESLEEVDGFLARRFKIEIPTHSTCQHNKTRSPVSQSFQESNCSRYHEVEYQLRVSLNKACLVSRVLIPCSTGYY
jgi:hypothetical protein